MSKKSYRDWTLPLQDDQITLREAMATLEEVAAGQHEIPWIIQLMENPNYGIPIIDIFHGHCDLEVHDVIHCLLGRGLLPKDEAFIIGFTMGSSNRINSFTGSLFCFIAKHFYPKMYRFDDECVKVFKHAWKLADISACTPLAEVDYEKYMDMSLKEVRETIGIEQELIQAYYMIEHKRYPDSRESRRLIAT